MANIQFAEPDYFCNRNQGPQGNKNMAYSYNAKTGEFEGPAASSRSASSRTTSPIASVYHTTAAKTPNVVRLASMNAVRFSQQEEALLAELSDARQAEVNSALRRIEEQRRSTTACQQPARSSYSRSSSSSKDNSWIWLVILYGIMFLSIIF